MKIWKVQAIDPLVLTTNGLVQGLLAEDGYYSMFLGVPYAQIDETNPFGIAKEITKSDEIYEAYDDSIVCPQYDDYANTIEGSLDCLKLNIYIPHSATSHNRLPVMIWIHGGGFMRWSSGRESYGPKFLVQHDVILVTLNYRLGPYGFMCLNTADTPGNAGLRDQLAALRWIKKNIAAFGGDVDNITLFGESAGAASVEFHMVSGLSDGLFHKVIMESGSILGDWVMAESDMNAPIKLAEQLGYVTENRTDAIDFLAKSDPHTIIAATLELNLRFKPCVEQRFSNVETMVKGRPSVLLQSDPYSSFPILSGFNSREGLETFYFLTQTPNYFETERKTFKAKLEDYFTFNTEELERAERLVHQFYIGDKPIDNDVVDEMIEFNSDFTFIYPLQRSTSYHLSRNDYPVYQYMFSYVGDRNYMKYRRNITEPGASHADEIGYLFDQSYITDEIMPWDQVMIDRMTTMWTNFAKQGDPTPNIDDIITVKWENTKQNARRFLIIDDVMNMDQHPYHQRMAFWDLFFELFDGKAKW
ncbi:Venom carboxylesterase-6 [Eumeta japonica]|uniref:Carboxylic ester hydrolase n=1 Tax=Eumeta variegata TaxID=151549 RepID=A0A4C1V2E8_EUMVA|nr:Venom carboxylesterase-6 [Eumeta japonica]